MPGAIEDYALLSDTQSAALVGRDGSVDWLTFPRFDSPACFAALLGGPDNGHWRIGPGSPVEHVERAYRPGTLVLDTTFHTAEGTVRLSDAMPVRDRRLDLVRVVEVLSGDVPLEIEITVRPDYGSIVPWVSRTTSGLRFVAGPDALLLRSPVELIPEGWAHRATLVARPGDRLAFDLTWYPSHEPDPDPLDAEAALEATAAWWREWSGRTTDLGDRTPPVLQSLVALKGLTYSPTGGIVAAPTTSLPEEPGGVRNWDYRYCWLRDASRTLVALLDAGFTEEAVAWRQWLERAVAGRPDQVQVMYGCAGERRLPEQVLPWLAGYEDSAPVRVGNAAHTQQQLDIFGEVLDALHQARMAGIAERDGQAWMLCTALVDQVAERWREPDEGIWEVRGGARHFTHSKVMAWVAIDRAIRSAHHFQLPAPLPRWEALRAAIHQQVLEHGVDERGLFVQSYDSHHLDASLLRIPLVGFLPADDPRVVATVEAIQRDLTVDGLVRRYLPDEDVDGVPGGEGAFLLCSFWLVEALALMGRREEAEALFERLLALRNDVGLMAEELDPATGRMLGNFPQSFSHTGLVCAAFTLAGRTAYQADGPVAPPSARPPR